MVNRILIAAGIFTVGAFFGHVQRSAEAASITLEPVVITSSVPTTACVDYTINVDDSATCFDGESPETFSLDHYMVEADTDGEGFYLVVWQ